MIKDSMAGVWRAWAGACRAWMRGWSNPTLTAKAWVGARGVYWEALPDLRSPHGLIYLLGVPDRGRGVRDAGGRP